MDVYKKPNESLADALREITDGMIALRNSMIPAIKEIVKFSRFFNQQITIAYCLAYSNNSKVKHLALHSKKARVRKKNIHRLQRGVMK